MNTTKNRTGLIILLLVFSFLIFMAFWGFDMLNPDKANTDNIEVASEVLDSDVEMSEEINTEDNDGENTEDMDQAKEEESNDVMHTDKMMSTRLTDEFGFNPAVIPTYGNPDGAITMVEFTNFYCGFCKIYHQDDFGRLLEKYEDDIYYASVYVFSDAYKNMDLTMATACSAQQDVNEYADYAFNLKSRSFSNTDLIAKAKELSLDVEEFTACFESKENRDLIESNEKIARDLGVYSTPFFMIDGQMLIGASFDYMDTAIADALALAQ